MTDELKKEEETPKIPESLPVLPLRDIVIFPFMIVPLYVSRERSSKAVDQAVADNRMSLLGAQKRQDDEDPGPEDVYPVGTVALIMRMLKLPDGRIRVLVQGIGRARIQSFEEGHLHLQARVEPVVEPEVKEKGLEVEALMRNVKPVLEEVERQLKKLERMHPDSAETATLRNWLDWMVTLPWGKSTKDNLDLAEAQRILDEDHYGLEKVKERIIEYLAVRKLKDKMKGPLLCFVGPPGVGKTSLGKSIARALGRKFVRLSLGGVKDEAEIRGHRRTYVGSMPGRIVQGIQQAGSNNPVFMMDEGDKIGADYRGDPSSSLLEVLDPEQNNSFRDHYLGVPFDLSNVMFICTANLTDTIQAAFLDRMEVIHLSGYTEDEKVEIAKRHLLPKQLEEHGITPTNLVFTDKALRSMINSYTREAGLP